MRIVIIEDEKPAAENLRYLLTEIDPLINVERIIDSVADAVEYFSKTVEIDVAFFDIHLADGNSFEIFEKVNVDVPIIFTTAYDEYALKAFKVNSIDYLLKPIDEDELNEAMKKFKTTSRHSGANEEYKEILRALNSKPKKYKSSFLVQQRDLLIPIGVEEVAYFTIDSGLVKAFTFDKKSYVIDEKLEDIETYLNPDHFFRANRQFIVQKRAITNLAIHFNGKLILNTEPKSEDRIIISKAKAPQIKSWIN